MKIGKRSKGLSVSSKVICCDNTGAKIVKIIGVKKYRNSLNRVPSAGPGDIVLVCVKKGFTELKKKICLCIVVRQKKSIADIRGQVLSFNENGVVLINTAYELRGSYIKGPVSKHFSSRWPRLALRSQGVF